MKWFIPPTRVTGSKRQTATHEPRSVRMIVGSRVAYTPPTWIATSALPPPDRSPLTDALRAGRSCKRSCRPAEPHAHAEQRSEEHTSELQSRLHLVCRLLLEKKKRSCRQLQTQE